MPLSLPSNVRVVLGLLVLLAGLLVSVSMGPGERDDAGPGPSSAVLEAPRLTLTLGRGRVAIEGTTRSSRHEALLGEVLDDRFRDYDVRRDFAAGIGVPEHWEDISVRLLYVMAAMESATAVMRKNRVQLRGVTARPQVFRQRLDFLRDALPATAAFDDSVIVIDDNPSPERLCRRWFDELGPLPVSFTESSAELRPSSYPSLDKLVDFAWHCREATILIQGHTDASGSEAWNRQLSRARAEAVADYLESNGVAAERLVVEGRGSADPIADNATRYGRSLNRRIEFALRSPLL